ncbi:recombination endonuclease VII [Micromonospora pisi]|uniref:Recombination endonuclease VII n=1 Tax=Micromonospora pisi TaxID=589240 RepID=A0A495JVH4_9ACTN|nr:endonuclease domain-containing protein [Micromonospora pisi]RKR92841.1 recombination endonuclease VII [Micromonospora pisi]
MTAIQGCCTRCGHTKAHSEFYKRRDGRLRTWCKACTSDYGHQRWLARGEENRAITRRQWLARKFGITVEQYNEMWRAQDGKCAICGQPETEREWLSVDHDHSDGTVRGLLCRMHNAALGGFGDSPELLLAAVEYLRTAKALIPERSQ